jgi:hypothetical protein
MVQTETSESTNTKTSTHSLTPDTLEPQEDRAPREADVARPRLRTGLRAGTAGGNPLYV